MGFTQKLIEATEAATADKILTFQDNGGGTQRLLSLFATNVSDQTVKVSLYLVPAGGTAAPGNCIFNGIELVESDTFSIDQSSGPIVPGGYSLMAHSTLGSAVNLTVTTS